MELRITEETPEVLTKYEEISIAFRVETFFRVELVNHGLGGVKLTEERIEKPFIKDYDEYEKPSVWAERFDLSNWGILSAFDGSQRIGGAAIAWKTPEIFMLEERGDLACLWDLRVASAYRGNKIGRHLFASAILWAKARNCRIFKVETQNINVPACRFYLKQGCELGAINRFAYPAEMNETQLVWYRKL